MSVVDDSNDKVHLTKEPVDSDDGFTLDAISDEDYEFGDEYEFDETVSDRDIFTTSETFDIADYIDSDASGTGFMKTSAGFTIVPNFNTALFYFRF